MLIFNKLHLLHQNLDEMTVKMFSFSNKKKVIEAIRS